MENKARSRLNDLPDHLLCKILSNLSTRDSVRSSVLSKRWRNLWFDVPVLDLNSSHFEQDGYGIDCERFVDRFLDKEHKLDIERFKIIFYYDEDMYSDDPFFKAWIDELVRRRVCDLDIECVSDYGFVSMPMSLYSCKTLVNLSLTCVNLCKPESKSVGFFMPCVKTMHLDSVRYDDDLILKKLIYKCPVLEKLTIIRDSDSDFLEVVSVRSNSLKRFTLESERVEERAVDDHAVRIDAPRLEHMRLFDHISRRVTIHSITPFTVVDIDVSFDVEDGGSLNFDDDHHRKRTMIRNFLTAISKVSKTKISFATLKVFHDYSRVESLPQFSNLSRLQASFLESSWEFLPTLLGCCPNLSSLVLQFESLTETKPSKLSYVPLPPFFVLSLEFVQLRTPVMKTTWSQMELATYFMRNCSALKKLS